MVFYPQSIDPGRCKFCGAAIFWAETFPNRRKVPLDKPVTSQNLQHDPQGFAIATLTSTVHFATCENFDPDTRQAITKAAPKEQARLF